MGDLQAKVAYLHGLAEGLDVDTSSSEGRLINAMLDVMSEMADELAEVAERNAALAEYLDDVDFDLGALEESVYEDGDVDDLPEDYEHAALISHEDGLTMVGCPQCGETMAAGFGEGMEEMSAVCPACGCMVHAVDCDCEDAMELHD